jgi:hypothetical protein
MSTPRDPRGKKVPHFEQAHLLRAAGSASESLTVATLQAERDRRAGRCLAEIQRALAAHRCIFQVVIQDIQIPGQPAVDRRCQVNVLPLELEGPLGAPTQPVYDAAQANGKPPTP